MSFARKNGVKISTEDARYNTALLHLSKGEVDQAVALLQSIYRNKGLLAERSLLHILNALNVIGKEAEAIHLLLDACKAFPNNHKWPESLASIWIKQGELSKAIECADRSLAIEPNNENMFVNRVCWLAGRSEDPLQARSLFETWGQRFMDPLKDQVKPLSGVNVAPDRRLRLGYVSGDLKNHSVRYFIEPFLRGHDRTQFEVHAFMTMAEDEVTQFLKPFVDQWHGVQDMDDRALLAFIRAQKIDILVDLSGHTLGQRLAVFAMRAAPVQVTWFGFMQTLGMEEMDWRLTDWGTSPQGTDEHFNEKLYRLNCMVAYSPPLNSEAQYPSPYHQNDYVTMISLNHTRKLGDKALATWRDILLENPRSGLILIGAYRDSDLSYASLAPRLVEAGFPMDRVSITPRLTMLEFMSLASLADFALDSYPISGGTTTLHALWMGLPILALEDPNFGGMSSSSALTLKGLQLQDFVATSIEHYQRKASELIREPALIDKLRERCRPALMNSPLMDHSARVQDVENAYRFMWKEFVESQGAAMSLGGR